MPRYDLVSKIENRITDPAVEYQKQQKRDMQKYIATAVKENYYNDENYYNQIQALAMQYGIPIAPPKMDTAKTLAGAALNLGTLGFADLLGVTGALGLESISPQGKKIQSAAGWVGALMPVGWAGLGIKGLAGAAAKLGGTGVKAGLKQAGKTGIGKFYGIDKIMKGAKGTRTQSAAAKTSAAAGRRTKAEIAKNAKNLGGGVTSPGGVIGEGAERTVASTLVGGAKKGAGTTKKVIMGLDANTKVNVSRILSKRGGNRASKLAAASDEIMAALGQGGQGVVGGSAEVSAALTKILKSSKNWSKSDILRLLV